jgi:sec-independent protein translocase protein TatA
MPGSPEILIVGVIVLVLFGASAIPRFARSIGRAKAEFEKGLTVGQKDADGAEGDRKALQDSAESDQKTG